MKRAAFRSRLAEIMTDREGSVYLWAFWVSAFLVLGGVAVDTAKAWRMQAMMQAAADAGTHAGSVAMWRGEDGVAAAKAYVNANIPEQYHENLLLDSDILFLKKDEDTGEFLTVENEEDADSIRIMLRRDEERGNGERTVLLRLLGFDWWSIGVQSTARYFDSIDECLRNGMVARGVIDFQSNNVFTSNICVHSQAHVAMNNGNSFDEGVAVSMPDPSRLSTPGGVIDEESNPGLTEALREGRKDPKIVDDLPVIIEQMRTAPGVINVLNSVLDLTLVSAGAHIDVTCTGGGDKTLTIPDNLTLYNVTITTNCGIKFEQGSKIYESVIATTGEYSSGAATVQAPSDVVIGYDDACADGGGSQLLINGSFKAASTFAMNGSQIIATDDIRIAAQVRGLNGISLISGDEIDVTSNNAFGGCPGSEFPVVYNAYAVVN